MTEFLTKRSKLIIIFYGVIIALLFVAGLYYSTNVAHVHVAYTVNKDLGVVSIDSDSKFDSTDGLNDSLFEYFYKSKDANSPFYNDNIVYKKAYVKVIIKEDEAGYREADVDFDSNVHYFTRKYEKVKIDDPDNPFEEFDKSKEYAYILEGKYVDVDVEKDEVVSGRQYYTFTYEAASITSFEEKVDANNVKVVYYQKAVEKFNAEETYYVLNYKKMEITNYSELKPNTDDGGYSYYTFENGTYKEIQKSTIDSKVTNKVALEEGTEIFDKVYVKQENITGFAENTDYYRYVDTDVIISSDFKSNDSSYGYIQTSGYSPEDYPELHIKEYGKDGKTIADMIYDFQLQVSSVNTFIIVVGVISLICFAIMLIFSNHNRRVYYKSNLYIGLTMPLIVIIFTIIGLIRNFAVMGVFNSNKDLFRIVSFLQDPEIDVATKLQACSDYNIILDRTSKFGATGFYLAMAAFIILAIYSVLIMIYTVYRYKECAKRRSDILERAANKND